MESETTAAALNVRDIEYSHKEIRQKDSLDSSDVVVVKLLMTSLRGPFPLLWFHPWTSICSCTVATVMLSRR